MEKIPVALTGPDELLSEEADVLDHHKTVASIVWHIIHMRPR